MKLYPSDLAKYSQEQYLEAFRYVKNGTKTSPDSPLRELVLGIRFFRRKYALQSENILDMRQMIEHIRNISSDFTDMGIMSELQRRVFQENDCSCDIVDLFHASPLTYFVWDAENTGWPVKNVSPNIFPNFGYDALDFLSGKLKFMDIIHSKDAERIQQEVHENIFVKKLRNFEQYYRVLDGQGNVRYIYDKTEVIYNPSGEVSKLYGFIMDISDRTRTEMLKDNYKEALDNSAVVQIVDKDGMIQYVNDLYRGISWDKRNIVGKKAKIMGGSKYHSPEFWKEMWDTIRSWKVWRGVIRNPRMDIDETYYTQTTITPLRDENGEYTLFIAVKSDVTELKEMKKIMEDSRNRLEKILNSTSQWFWIINQNLEILDINDALSAMIGYERSEIIGKTIVDLFDDENRRILDKQVRTIETTDHRIYEIKLRRKDGTNLPVILQATTIRNDQGEISEIVAFITDVSDMHEALKKDALTGVYNRGCFDTELKKSFALTREGKIQEISIAIFDLDHFKRINDQYGHPIGDMVLRKIGTLLRSISTENLMTFRFGWEEFVVIGRDIDIDTMKDTMEAFRMTVENAEISSEKGDIWCTISAGVTSYKAGDSKNATPAKLLESADGCLYKAKNDGRNCVQVEMRRTERSEL